MTGESHVVFRDIKSEIWGVNSCCGLLGGTFIHRNGCKPNYDHLYELGLKSCFCFILLDKKKREITPVISQAIFGDVIDLVTSLKAPVSSYG